MCYRERSLKPTLLQCVIVEGIGVLEWRDPVGVALSLDFPAALCCGICFDNRIAVRPMPHRKFTKLISLFHKLLLFTV